MDKTSKETGVDGRINLGFRRLVISHVENAGSFYAYKEEEADAMSAIDKLAEQCASMPGVVTAPLEGRVYGAFHSGRWFRAQVEQISLKDERKVRVRMVDYGWNDFVKVSELRQLPKSLLEAKIKCEKYKMAEMKPRGRYEGYSAEDREKGKKWLEKMIDGRVVEAECHILVKFGGGIQVQCKIGGLDLNEAALESGHVILLKDRGKIVNEVSGKRNDLKNLRKTQKQNNNQMKSNHKRGVEKDKCNDGKKWVNEDINEIVLLLDQAAQIRKTPDESSEVKNKNIILNLIDIPETIEEALDVVGTLLEGIEAVAAASKLREDAKNEMENDAHKVALLETTTILYKCISKFLGEYSLKQTDIDNIVEKVEKHLSSVEGIPSTIPASWKLLSVKADKVTKNNILDIVKNVKKYLDETGAKLTQLSAASQAQVDNLANCLREIATAMQAKVDGGTGPEIPSNVASHMKNLKSALEKEISENNRVRNLEKTEELTEARAVSSAWRALTALNSQLQLIKCKKNQFEIILKDLEADTAP